MAILSPTIEVIKRQKVQPTEGEWTLLNFLMGQLDDTYEIYYQPYLNGDNPDFAIMRKGSGVLLVEVKDWNLKHYYIDENKKWRLRKDATQIKSPLNQVENYKSNLFKLHINELFKKTIKSQNHWATVNCAIYFHNETEQDLINFLINDFRTHKDDSYNKFISYFGLMGYNSLTKEKLNLVLTKFWLNKKSYYFDDILYISFKRYLKPPTHQLEEGIEINYSREQQDLIRSEIRPRRKIKGVAGSGKTLILAKRAVNAHKRTGGRILILTYNLSLKNYIYDRISDVREEFDWSNFYITNYHQFFKTQSNNYNLEILSIASWQNTLFFDSVKEEINKYDVILIDEIQDYMQPWIDIITTYFTHPETEFIVFGDEKQNIYERELDENNEIIVRQIAGRWNKSLNKSFRLVSSIYITALLFQNKFFEGKYNLDHTDIDIQKLKRDNQLSIDFTPRIIEYHYFNSFTADILFKKIYSILLQHQIHSSDVGILCSKVAILRAIDFLIRTKKHENTSITFEMEEEYLQNEENSTKIEVIRRLRKNHFYMKTGTVKLSTIHSFKGWEIETLFLLIENGEKEKEFENAELVYTGLTRAKKNLIIFNLGNKEYHDFFRSEIEQSFVHQDTTTSRMLDWDYIDTYKHYFNSILSTYHDFNERELILFKGKLFVGSPCTFLDSGSIFCQTTFGLIFNKQIVWTEYLKNLYHYDPLLLYSGGGIDEYGYQIDFNELPLDLATELQKSREYLLEGSELHDQIDSSSDYFHNIYSKSNLNREQFIAAVEMNDLNFIFNSGIYNQLLNVLHSDISDFNITKFYERY
ncbi:nuclease-related domain-containing DEAD/DEAH box helicase [Dyadobacter chenhuakuii]|uniref:DNA 3'-5' helicase II n=1 Tax=Dyadobacter chenhuakuii TaxID=2909339 RepID=A0ABY4XLZ6_9BACT|nr:NERD domain-containing protein/DEAD/DEAH box helicase [Dyadobacter chenhuakuii]MCF2494283.1 NERD domain-containing protein/DEAD/DEAH box helicase [Dyadobacter chenhuakuii]USJ31408.1 NERD domain-containing protein/DEAD/DEAH box helicase [Dyadobacter chenhuakuii]